MKILVTGAAGFIGSHTTDQLLATDHDVLGVDNLSIGSANNLEEARKSKMFSFNTLDVTDRKAVMALGKDFDVIIHEAACKIPVKGDTVKTLLVNTEGTKNMIELALKSEARLVFASTSDVYGKSGDMPFKEDGDLVLGSPEVRRWAYATSKMFDEHLVQAYHEENGLKFVILRYFNSYGPRGYLGLKAGPPLVFITDAIEKKKITIHGDGTQKRCFCYCTDTAHGTVLAATKKEAENQTINIGNDRTEIAINDLAKMTLDKLGDPEVKIGYMSHSKFYKGKYDEVMRRVADLSKARKLLGYEPYVGLEEGIRKTVEWGKKMLVGMRVCTTQ
jgi:UDP-glucose 4-epimerase